MNIEKLAKHLKKFTLDEIEMIAECDCKTELERLLNGNKITFEQGMYKYVENIPTVQFNIFIENKTVDVVHIKCMKNYGFAIGNNIGTEIAKENYKFDYILFSNSDITFNNGLNLNNTCNFGLIMLIS